MDIVLVNPADLRSPYPPMGLVELGTFLEAEGYSVRIVDFSLEGKKKGIEDIISLNPKVVGVSILFGTIQQASEILAEIQKRIDCILTVGGYYPTFKTKHCLDNLNCVDFAILGEGEMPNFQLLEFVIKGRGKPEAIAGLAYKKGTEVFIQQPKTLIDLSILPSLDLGLIKLSEYPKKKGKRIITVSASRGCNSGCTFCSQTKFWRNSVRFKNPESVIRTIEQAIVNYEVDYIRILDDNFLSSGNLAEIITLYLKSTGLPWECQARADSLNLEILRCLANRGLDRIFMGIETASPKIQKIFKKTVNLNHASTIIEEARRLGVNVKVSFQIGAPCESRDDIRKTIEFASTLNLDEIALFITTPFPGTEIEKIATDMGLLNPYSFTDLDPSVPSMGTGYLSIKEVEEEAKNFIDKVKMAQWGHHSRKGRQQTLK